MKGSYKVIIIIGNILIYIEHQWEYTNKQLELVGKISKMAFKVAARKTKNKSFPVYLQRYLFHKNLI